jgi:ADP-heptose:LPS heptosyltransferase
MEKSKCLVVTCGFFGDIIFATSLAEKLKHEKGFNEVDYLIGFPQVLRLVKNNPHIGTVYVSDSPSAYPVKIDMDDSQYSEIIRLQQLNYKIPPTCEYQQLSGIKQLSSEYKVYTELEYDRFAKKYVDSIREDGKKVIAVMSNWQPKTYLFTPEQYKAGIDVPNLGYGGSHRDIAKVITDLSNHFILLEVGVPVEYSQAMTSTIADDNHKSLLFEASLMKYCDAFIGTDGGLATIAAGVGTKTVITGDFNLQLYGWNGVIKKVEQPRLGPYEYFGEPHIVLDPYLSDEEVTQAIISNLGQ